MKVKLTIAFLLFAISVRSQVVILPHTYYTCYYDTIKKAPIYSTYILTKAHLDTQACKRSPRFFADPMVSEVNQANNKTYWHNGKYDKGHLSPDDDFRFDSTAEHEAMYYTNVAPQISSFNRITWKAVETFTRNICEKYDSVTVWTGCIYGSDQLNGISVPIDYWKVIRYDGQIQAWLGKNEPNTNSDQSSISDSVEDVEKLTGLTF